MLKERIQEVFEFTKSESPYRKANKGWINQDIFLDLSPSSDFLKQKNEDAKVTLYWSPITSFLTNIFIILIISSMLVFASISFAKGRLNFNSFNTSLVNDIEKVEDINLVERSNLNSFETKNSELKQVPDLTDFDKIETIDSLDDFQNNADQELINNKIDQQENVIRENESEKVIKNIENKKSKSNFI